MRQGSWVVARASGGRYDPSCFRLEHRGRGGPEKGQLLIATRLLSLDPTHLNWIKLDPVMQYLPVRLGDAMLGANIGTVLRSEHPDYREGDVVTGIWGWQEEAVADAAMVRPALPEADMPFEEQLAILSHVGQAAAGGMIGVANVCAGDAVLVSAAAGATGSIAAQIAKAKGARTVGIAGGPDKCRYLVEELGLDAAIDYRSEELEEAIPRHFPEGIDLFFDNVGGATLDVVLDNMALRCRIAICGAIAQYDRADDGGFGGVRNLPMLIFRQARMEGFVAGQFGERNAEFNGTLLQLYRAGKLRVRTQTVPFAEMPQALQMLLTGRNEGKLMACVDGAAAYRAEV